MTPAATGPGSSSAKNAAAEQAGNTRRRRVERREVMVAPLKNRSLRPRSGRGGHREKGALELLRHDPPESGCLCR
jgi:hypothetical protein